MPPTGRCERSIGPMLSRPRKPPSNRLLPSSSSRLTHQVKLTSSLLKTRLRKSRSRPPSMANTSSAAHACTGGLTSPKSHSYAGRAPFGCWNHSRHSRISWYLANAGSTWASATVWKARSQAANQGYSHLSGIDMMSNASKFRHREFRPPSRWAGGTGWPGPPSSQHAGVLGAERVGRRAGRAGGPGAKPEPQLGRCAAPQGELVPVGTLGAGPVRVDGVRPVHHVVVDAVLRVRRDRRRPEQPGHVGL